MTAKQLTVFISSKMAELKPERDLLFDLLPTLNTGLFTVKAWVYEEYAPAAEKPIREVYLNALKECQLYIGLFWNEYGEWTIDEYERAGEWGIPRHVYVKNVDTDQRDPKLKQFLEDSQGVTDGLSHKWFQTPDDLIQAVSTSIAYWIDERLRPETAALSAIQATHPDGIINAPRKLIGRDDLKPGIIAQLSNGERVLLHGFAGIGKTALAATLAREWLQDGRGSVLWLKAGNANADSLFEALARPFKASRAIASAVGDERMHVMRQLLRGTSLLVLDDAWNGQALDRVLQAVPDTLPVLVTARHTYPINHKFEVDRLTREHAIATLGLYAGQDYTGDTGADALCDLLGDHAFALEVAGSTLNVDGISPQDLHNQIKAAPYDIRMPLDMAPEGRQSFSQLLEISLHQLDVTTREVFTAFGALFTGSATPELLGLLLERDDVATSLTAVTRRGLAQWVDATDTQVAFYRLHDLAYSYARANTDENLRQKAIDACLVYTERYLEPSRENFMALEADLDNLLAAAAAAMKLGRLGEIEEFAWNLYGKSQVLDYRGYHLEATRLLAHAVQAARHVGNMHSEGAQLGNLGTAYYRLGQYEKAIEHYQQALAIAREIGDRRGEGNWLGNLGTAYESLEQYEEAIEHHQQALAIAREIGDRRGEGGELGNLGNVYRSLGQYDEAIGHYQQALAIAREIGDRRGECNGLGSLGLVYGDLGQYEEAIKHYHHALVVSREIGDRYGERNSLVNLGNAYRSLGQYEEAIGHYQQALVSAREIGDRRGEGNWLGNLGNVYQELGQYEAAIEHYQQVLIISREIGDRRGEGNWLGNLGTAYYRLGQYEEAIEHYQQALVIFEELGVPHLIEQVKDSIAKAKAEQALDE